MAAIFLAIAFAVFFALTFVAWRRYLWAAEKSPHGQTDTCQYSLTDVFGDHHFVNVPHQNGVRWLTEVFSRSAEKFPHLTALQIPHTGESLTFAELNARAENLAAALSPFLTGPDQVVAVAMSQDNWQIVASHLGILKAGGTVLFLDTTLPDALVTHMLNDAQPVVILTRGQDKYRAGSDKSATCRRSTSRRCRRGCPQKNRRENRRPGWTTPSSALRPSFTRAEPPGCPRAWSARTQAT